MPPSSLEGRVLGTNWPQKWPGRALRERMCMWCFDGLLRNSSILSACVYGGDHEILKEAKLKRKLSQCISV
jgi:hypothetical protein